VEHFRTAPSFIAIDSKAYSLELIGYLRMCRNRRAPVVARRFREVTSSNHTGRLVACWQELKVTKPFPFVTLDEWTKGDTLHFGNLHKLNGTRGLLQIMSCSIVLFLTSRQFTRALGAKEIVHGRNEIFKRHPHVLVLLQVLLLPGIIEYP
jgi:hypothetical protein